MPRESAIVGSWSVLRSASNLWRTQVLVQATGKLVLPFPALENRFKGAQNVAQNHRRDVVQAIPLHICKFLESNTVVEENLMAAIEKF
jgi:hypothetical protein